MLDTTEKGRGQSRWQSGQNAVRGYLYSAEIGTRPFGGAVALHQACRTMEALKAHIVAQKRKVASETGSTSKYMRRGSIEQMQRAASAEEEHDLPSPPARALTNPTSPPQSTQQPEPADESNERFTISNEEAVKRLRQKGEPIRLFGETDRDRRLRLRALELLEEHDVHAQQGHDDSKRFMRTSESQVIMDRIEKHPSSQIPSESTESREATASLPSQARVPAPMREGIGMHTVMDLKLMWSDPARVYPILYYTLKGLLEDWGEALAQRPEDVRLSAQGRHVASLHAQTSEYIKPLLKALRRRSLEPDVLLRIAEIVHYMQLREYRKANDSYLQLSIGNAPWPIGITMAGYVPRRLTKQHP